MKNIFPPAPKRHDPSQKYEVKLSQFDKFLFYLNPKTVVGVIYALIDQTPNSHRILFNIVGAVVLNAILPIVLLQLSLSHLPSSLSIANVSADPSSVVKTRGSVILNLYQLHDRHGFSSPSIPISNLLIPAAFSPFTIATCSSAISSQISFFVNRFKMWKILRSDPDDEAIICLDKYLNQGQAIRTKAFDIYFPPPSSRSTNYKHQRQDFVAYKRKGLLFLPGAFVDHTSYSTIARKIAERGIIVVVLSMEPFRLAFKGLGADFSAIKGAIKYVEKESGDLIEWSVGGHSAGAYGAMQLSSQVKRYLVNHRKRQEKMKLVIWAAGNIQRYVPILSNQGKTMEAIVILGSNDSYANFTSSEGSSLQSFLSKLPTRQVCRVIDGGNHDNFGAYIGPIQSSGVSISRKKQHKSIVDATTQFLLNDNIR